MSARAMTFIAATLLFVIAAVLLVYALWSYANVQAAVEEAIAAGQLALPGSEYDIASFAMSSSGEYGILAVMVAVLGWLVLQSGSPATRVTSAPAASSLRPSPQEDELDDLLAGMADDGSVR